MPKVIPQEVKLRAMELYLAGNFSARENAETMISKAKTHIEAESQKAIQEIKSSVVNLSIEAAEKIIEKNLDSEDNRKLVEKTLDSIGQA